MGSKLKFENITSEFDAADVQANKFISLLSYLGILVLVPIFVAKDSKFAKFHANQGLVLIISIVALEMINIIIGVIFGLTIYKIPVAGTILNVIISLAFLILILLLFVLIVCGIVTALQGKAIKFPFFDKLTILK